MCNLSDKMALSTNPLGTSQEFISGQDDAHTTQRALDQRQSIFNGAAALMVPIEKAPPTVIINNPNNLLSTLPKESLDMTTLVPNWYPKTGPTSINLPVLPHTGSKEEPRNSPAVGPLPSQRPVRKSSLRRTFNVDELEGYSSDDDQKSNQSGQRKKRRKQNSQSSYEIAAAVGIQQPGPRRGRPPKNAHVKFPAHKERLPMPWEVQHQVCTPAARNPPPQQCLPQGRPQEVIPCSLDTPWPRKLRSELKTCPKTSRASITRLKQAAYGRLPLGGSKGLALALLGGGAGELDDNDVGYSSEDLGDDYSRHHRTASKQQARSGSKGAFAGHPYQRHNRQQSQQNKIAPNPDQRKAMSEIASAPPHLRAALLQQLMQEKLGVPLMPESPFIGARSGNRNGMNRLLVQQPSTAVMPSPLLSALPRSEQQQIVKQLLSQMTPQQRHVMLQSSISHQAALIQQYYAKYVAPMRLQLQQPLERQPLHGLNPMVPLSAVAPTTTTATTTAGHVLQREESTTPLHALPLNNTSTLLPVKRASFLRGLLSELGESAEAQLSAMPREQQKKILLGLIQRRRQKLLMQQEQEQSSKGYEGRLPIEFTRHQLAPQSRPGSLDVGNNAMMNHPLDRHHYSSSLDSLPGQNGGFAVPPGGVGGAVRGLYAPDGVGLDGMLGSGLDSDALEDAMNFLV